MLRETQSAQLVVVEIRGKGSTDLGRAGIHDRSRLPFDIPDHRISLDLKRHGFPLIMVVLANQNRK